MFYPERGSIIRGVPTGAAAPLISEELASTPENSPVWPHAAGRARSYALEPLYPTVPEIVLLNPTLHGAFAAVDLLRIGSARERAVASKFLERLIRSRPFRSRGGDDYIASKDIEDLVAVLHGREEIVDEVFGASSEVQQYLARQADELLRAREFEESLSGHLPGEDTTRVTQRLEQIAKSARA